MISYIIVLCLIGLAAGDKDMKQANAGVIFKSRGAIQSSSSVWYHTFALDLPTLPNKWLHYQMADPVMPPVKCTGNPGDSECSMPAISMSNLIISLNAEVVKAFDHLLDLTRTFIPKHASTDQKRRKRFGPLSFIGSISKSIFGTATVEDVERVSSNVNELIRRQRLTAQTMVAHERNFQSFVKLSSSRFNGLKKIVSDNHEALKMIRNFEVNSTDIINRRLYLLEIAMFQMNKTYSIIHHLRDIGQAIEQLHVAQGYISPLLVSEKAISGVVKEINNKIIDMTNTKDHGVLADYGFDHHTPFFCQLQGNTILLTIKFQVVPLLRKAHLYQVMVYPVPTTKNSKHATKIAGLPEYVIISEDNAGKQYSPITSVQLSNCRGIHHVVCPFNLVYTSVLKENCLTSLIKDSSDAIAKFCDFRYFHDHLEPSIEPISDNSFLVNDIPRLSLNIRGHIKDVEGCHLCIITIPCHARIQTVDMTSDRALSQNCNGEETEVTRDHLVNLAMVKAFIAENNQLGLTASSVFSKAQDVNVPKFDFFEYRYHEFLTTGQKTNLKLNKMVEASKRQEQVFQNIAEPFIKASEENASWLTSSPSVGDIVVNISLIVGTVVFIRLIFIVKGFGAIIAVNALAKGVESTKLDSPIHGMIQFGEQYENLDAPACVPSADVVFVGVICMLLLVAIFGLIVFRLCWKWMKGVDFSHAGKIHLYLHIYDQINLEQVSIFIQSIDFSRDLTVQNPKDLNLTISMYSPSWLTTVLKVTPELEMFDDEGNSFVFFTSGITLSYIQARKIDRIHKRGIYKHVLFLSYGGHLLNLRSTVRNRCPVDNDTSFCFENV